MTWTTGAAAGSLTAMLLVLASTAGGAFGVFAKTPADWLFVGLMGVAAALEAGLSAACAGDAAPETARSVWPGALAVATGAGLLLLSAGPLAVQAHPLSAPRSSVALVGGAVLMVLGVLFRVTAIVQLGGRFNSTNAIAPGAALEDRGVYRVLAHPSEVGLLLLVIGGLVLVARPVWWLLLVPFYALILARVGLEERALCVHHGDAYRRYRARTFDPMPRLTTP